MAIPRGQERDRWAREVIFRAWTQYARRAPTLAALQFVQAICRFESFYGAYWKTPAGQRSNNWGAVKSPGCMAHPLRRTCVKVQWVKDTSGKLRRVPTDESCSDCFLEDDHIDRPDGSRIPDPSCFRVYSTPEAGALHTIQSVLSKKGVVDVINSGNIDKIAYFMKYGGGYYQGSVRAYAGGVFAHASQFASFLNEPLKLVRDPSSSIEHGTITAATPGAVAANVAANAGPLAFGLAAGMAAFLWLSDDEHIEKRQR